MSPGGRVTIPVALAAPDGARACGETEPFALRVTDASMAPEFPEGCVIVVDPGLAPVEGDFVVAEVAGRLSLGRLEMATGGARLRVLTVVESTPVDGGLGGIRGVVTERVGRRRRDRARYR